MKLGLFYLTLISPALCVAQLAGATWPPKSCSPPFQLKLVRYQKDTLAISHRPCDQIIVYEIGSERCIQTTICDSGRGAPTYTDRREWGYRMVSYFDSSGRNIFSVAYKHEVAQGCRNFIYDSTGHCILELGYEAGKPFRKENYYKDGSGTLEIVMTTTENEITTIRYLPELDKYGYPKQEITRKRIKKGRIIK